MGLFSLAMGQFYYLFGRASPCSPAMGLKPRDGGTLDIMLVDDPEKALATFRPASRQHE